MIKDNSATSTNCRIIVYCKCDFNCRLSDYFDFWTFKNSANVDDFSYINVVTRINAF